jgi:hypothetical protein
VGWHKTVAQELHITTVWACEKTVVMAKHPNPEIININLQDHLPQVGLTRALDVHKVRVRRLYESLELVLPLLVLVRGVEEINCESLEGLDEHIGRVKGFVTKYDE